MVQCSYWGQSQLFCWLVFVVLLEPPTTRQGRKQRPSQSVQSDQSQQLTEAAAVVSGLSYSSCYGSCLQEFFHSQLWLAMFLFLNPSDNGHQTRSYIMLAKLMGMQWNSWDLIGCVELDNIFLISHFLSEQSAQRTRQDGFSWFKCPAEQPNHVQKWMWLLLQRWQRGTLLSLL